MHEPQHPVVIVGAGLVVAGPNRVPVFLARLALLLATGLDGAPRALTPISSAALPATAS